MSRVDPIEALVTRLTDATLRCAKQMAVDERMHQLCLDAEAELAELRNSSDWVAAPSEKRWRSPALVALHDAAFILELSEWRGTWLDDGLTPPVRLPVRSLAGALWNLHLTLRADRRDRGIEACEAICALCKDLSDLKALDPSDTLAQLCAARRGEVHPDTLAQLVRTAELLEVAERR